MSDATTTSEESPIAKAMNSVLMLGVPAVLLVMLGLFGFFFVAGMGDPKEEEAETETAAVAAAPAPAATEAAPAPAPAPAGGGDAPAAAPAADQAAAGGGAEIDPAVMELGKTTFATCAACHGPDGKGLAAGPMLMAPSFHGADGAAKLLLDDNVDKGILVVLKGIQKEGMDYMGMMAPLGAGLSDEQIAAVLTYLRNSYGNSASAVTAEQVATAREKYADVNAPAGVKRGDVDSIVGAE